MQSAILDACVDDGEAFGEEIVEAVWVGRVNGGEDIVCAEVTSHLLGIVDASAVKAESTGIGVDNHHVEGDGVGGLNIEVGSQVAAPGAVAHQ